MEEQIGPLCRSVAANVESYASTNRPKTKGSQKNLYLGELLYGIATYGNDEILTAFFDVNLEKFSKPKAKMGSAFLGRAILCGVHAFLEPTDEKRIAFQAAYDKELKSRVLAPDPDKKIPTTKDRPGYVAHIKDAVTTKLAGLNKTELLDAYLSLFKTVCAMEDTPLRRHLVDALKGHFNKNTTDFTAAVLRVIDIEAAYLTTLLTLEPSQKRFFEETQKAQPVVMPETAEEEVALTFDKEDDGTSRLLTAKTLADDLSNPATSSYVKSMREYAARQPKFSSVPVLGGLIQGRVDYAPIGDFLANVCVLDVELMLASLYALLHKLSTDETLKSKVESSVFVEEQLQAAFQFSFTEASRKTYEKDRKIKLSTLTYFQKIEILDAFKNTVFTEYRVRQPDNFEAGEAAQQRILLLNPIMSDVLTESTTYDDRKTILQALLYYFSAVKNPGDNNSAAAFKAKVLELKYDSMHHKFQQLCEKTLPQISVEIGEHRTEQVRHLPEAATVAAASAATTVESTEQLVPVPAAAPAPDNKWAAMAQQHSDSPHVSRAAAPPRATVVVVAADSLEAQQQAQRNEVGNKSRIERAKAQLAKLGRGSKDVAADANKQSDKSLTK